MFNKRGLSGIVTTLLIVVVSFIAVGLVWVVIQNLITEGLEDVGLQGINNNVRVEQVSDEGDTLSVKVRRDKGDAEISKLKFVVSDGLDSETVELDVSGFDALETKTLSVPYVGLVKSIQVIPVLIDSNGKEKDGNAGEKKFSDEEAIENMDGIVSWWKLDGNADDSVGSNHGALYNDVDCSAEGKYGEGCYFDGVGDYMTLPSTVDTTLNNGVSTFMLHMYIEDVNVNGGNGYAEAYSTQGATISGVSAIQIVPGSRVQLVLNSSSYYRFDTEINLKEWYHFSTEIDRTNNIAKVYKNGDLVDEVPFSPYTANPSTIKIGSNRLTGNVKDWFNGTIDNVMIFNRGLSALEIKALANLDLS